MTVPRKRRLVAALALGMLVAAACVHRVPSQTPRSWQLRGAVAAIQDTTIRVRHKSGQIVVLRVDDQTTFLRNKHPTTADALIVGTRVVVDVIRRGGEDHAVRVQVFGGARPES